MNAAKTNIAVAILNWNGLELLKSYLSSVVKYSTEATVYVIDNASTDASIDYFKKNFPEVQLIIHSKNLGFAGGYNTALDILTEDYVILLNSDVIVKSAWIKPLISALEQDSSLAVVQPKIKSLKQPKKFEYAGAAGGYIDRFGYPFCRGRLFDELEEDHGQYETVTDIFWASGACFAVKRSLFNQVGGFDNDYFAHQEEIDLCWRFHNTGYKVRYIPQSEVFHLGGGSLAYQNPQKTYLNFRNSLNNLIKNAPSPVFILLVARFLMDSFAALLYLLQRKPKHTLAIIKAYREVITMFDYTKGKRTRMVSAIPYFLIQSVIWRYFILNQKKFTDLHPKKC